MLDTPIARSVIDHALSLGADFAELFIERNQVNSISTLSSEVQAVAISSTATARTVVRSRCVVARISGGRLVCDMSGALRIGLRHRLTGGARVVRAEGRSRATVHRSRDSLSVLVSRLAFLVLR